MTLPTLPSFVILIIVKGACLVRIFVKRKGGTLIASAMHPHLHTKDNKGMRNPPESELKLIHGRVRRDHDGS